MHLTAAVATALRPEGCCIGGYSGPRCDALYRLAARCVSFYQSVFLSVCMPATDLPAARAAPRAPCRSALPG
eukprot:scaffold55198_cov69-Phaeocystis_antarctica.AAC.2